MNKTKICLLVKCTARLETKQVCSNPIVYLVMLGVVKLHDFGRNNRFKLPIIILKVWKGVFETTKPHTHGAYSAGGGQAK